MKKQKKVLMRLIPIALILILTVVLSEIFYQNLVDSSIERCWEEMATAHGEASREIDTRLNTNLKILDLASDAIMMNADFDRQDTVLAYLAGVQETTIFDRIDVIFPNGTILIQNGQIVPDNGEKTYGELTAKGSHISQRVPDFYAPDREAIHLFSPVYDIHHEPIAILGATIYSSTLANLFTSAHYGENAMLFLVDMRDGKIVSDMRSQQPGSIYDMQNYAVSEDSQGKDFISDILAGNKGTMSYDSKTYGMTSYTYYAPVKNTNFTLIMTIQEDVAFADVQSMRTTLMWVGAIEVALLLIFAVWIYNIMKKSMESEKRASNAELALLHQKEQELQQQYEAAADRQSFLEVMAVNLPGGYHRCSTSNGFILSFVSNSFLEITGYTREQLEKETNNSYINVVAPEDREYFMSLEPELMKTGRINCAYRIMRRDGSLRWVQDSTQRVESDGQQYYQCTLADIHDFVNDLNEAKQAAEESNHAKTTFLFNASHDIRTPMNAISGFAHIIEQNADDPETVRVTIAKILQSSKTLMTLLNDVLELSRIEHGKDELHMEKVSLFEHAENLFEMFAEDMKAAGILFKKEAHLTHGYVLCDPIKLMRIGMNFLSNAKKFTKRGGTVAFGIEELSSDGTSATYRFYTKDTGIGMSKEFQERAFSQFERERTTTESGVAGNGLGLSITKRIIDLMGGQCTIESEIGKGTEISAILTLTLADEVAHQGEENHAQTVDLTGKCVLLVEDNDFNREIAKFMLEEVGCEVDIACDGQDAVAAMNEASDGKYHYVLMDMQMPIMNGIEATKCIRSSDRPYLKMVPIIALTANAFNEDVERCLEAGMDAHIAKPFEIKNMIATLNSVRKWGV